VAQVLRAQPSSSAVMLAARHLSDSEGCSHTACLHRARSFADRQDLALTVFGAAGALTHGVALPLFTVVIGAAARGACDA